MMQDVISRLSWRSAALARVHIPRGGRHLHLRCRVPQPCLQAQDDVVNEEINDSGAVAQSNTSEDINTDADASASEEICTTSMAWLLIIVMGQWSCTEKTYLPE